MKLRHLFIMGMTVLLMNSCIPDSKETDKTEIIRLDLAIDDSNEMSTVELDSLNIKLRPGLEALYKINTAGGKSLTGHRLESMSNEATDIFTPDVRKRLTSLGKIEKKLKAIKDKSAEYLPAINFPAKIYSVVWPYNQSVVNVDTIMFIALNHYLGKDYQGYEGFEEFRKREKEQDRIPFDVAEALVRTYYPYRPSKTTIASRLLYEGAVLTAVKELTGEDDNRTVLSYTDDMMKWADTNEGKIWTALVNKQLLFSSSAIDADRLFNPSPATTTIHSDAPGRIGRYIGLRMIESLKDVDSDITLPQILSSKFYDSPTALQRTRYSPK